MTGPDARRRTVPALALVALLTWIAASPPAVSPGAGWLVLPGLAAFHALIRTARVPLRWAYLLGVVHVAWFSWSLRHVSLVAWALIALAGGVYYLLIAAWTRGFGRLGLPSLGFALGVAATAWLRGHVPEIPYPHGQFAHALHAWPAALGPVRWGGEVAMHLVLAGLAAALVEAWSGRRRGAARVAAAPAMLVVVWGLLAVFAPPAVTPRRADAAPVDVLAIEPGVAPSAPIGSRDFAAVAHLALVAATRQELAAAPADVVLWPESGLPEVLRGEPARLIGVTRPMDDLRLAADTLLVAGTTRSFPRDGDDPALVERRVAAVALATGRGNRLRLAGRTSELRHPAVLAVLIDHLATGFAGLRVLSRARGRVKGIFYIR